MVNLVVAYNYNFIIGKNGSIPWHIPDDLKFFKSVTMGHPVVYGRKTYDSIPVKFRPLPGRTNIIVSKTIKDLPGVMVFSSVEEAIEYGKSIDPEIFIVGGGEIYKYCLNNDLADCVIASEIRNHENIECEADDQITRFPNLKLLKWKGEKIKEFNEFDVVKYIKP